MKILRQLISAVALSILASTAVAQTVETTPNLITSGTGHTWTGVSTGSMSMSCPSNGGACSGGPGAIYDPATNTIHFSTGLATAAQTFAINQALANSGSGIQVQGYNYSWEINNLNYDNRQPGTDTLTARVITFDPAGNIRRNDSWTYNTRFDWTTFSGSVNYFTPGPTSEFGNLRVEFQGQDSGGWGGYYGPQVRNVDIGLRYTVAPVDPCVSDPQSSSSCPGFKTFYTISDDSHAIVPIPFGFLFYGQTFTHSIFFDNGAVSFYTPGNANHPQRWGGGGLSMPALSESMSSSFFYTIIPLKTDLIANGGRHFTQGNSNYLRYTWEDVSQFGRWDSRNTFSLEIRPTGYIGLQYDKIDIQGSWTSAIIGNASLGEYQLINSSSSTTTTAINSWSINETTATDCSIPLNSLNCPGYQTAVDSCNLNVLNHSYCPGYNTALTTCSSNPLSNVLCTNYQTAYDSCDSNVLNHSYCIGYSAALTTCSSNPLSNVLCTNYQTAYDSCDSNVLNHSYCPGHNTALTTCDGNPLSNELCTDYQTAIDSCSSNELNHNYCLGYSAAMTTCSTNPLSNVLCPTYQTAVDSCNANVLNHNYCTGYAAAQTICSTNPLSNELCFGHNTAVDSCNSNVLNYNYCPGYDIALTTCSSSPLSNSLCSGYADAQALCSTNPLSDNMCSGYQVASTDCNANELSHGYCPNYTSTLEYCSTDPLSNNLCPTYQSSLNQCTDNPLSNSFCPGHTSAVSSCSSNVLNHSYCPGYDTAMTTCSTNPLSNILCPTYQTAVDSCNANDLNHGYCPGYNTALTTCSTNPLSNILCSDYERADSVCKSNQLTFNYCPKYDETRTACFADPQSNSKCPGYSEKPTDAVVTSVEPTNVVEVNTATASTQTSSSVTSDPVAVVELNPEPAAVLVETKTDAAPAKEEAAPPAPRTTRQALAERRQAAARAAAIERAKEATDQLSSADSMEQQVEMQDAVIGAMGIVPGFDAYGRATVPDAAFYPPFEIYPGQQNIDTPAARGLLGRSDRLHQEMVDEQYR